MLKIISDTYSSDQLKKELEAVGNLTFELIPEEGGKTRSIDDPTILAAVIGAGATTFGAVVGLIGLWLSNRKNKSDIVIEIKMTKEIAQILLADKNNAEIREEIVKQVSGNNTNRMILNGESLAGLSEKERLFFDSLPESEVDYISIIEDL